MGNLIAIAEWLGRRGDLLKPEEINFTSKQSHSCKGCIFDGQKSSVCRQANALARLADLPDCDFGAIYVLRETDPRQLQIEGTEHATQSN